MNGRPTIIVSIDGVGGYVLNFKQSSVKLPDSEDTVVFDGEKQVWAALPVRSSKAGGYYRE